MSGGINGETLSREGAAILKKDRFDTRERLWHSSRCSAPLKETTSPVFQNSLIGSSLICQRGDIFQLYPTQDGGRLRLFLAALVHTQPDAAPAKQATAVIFSFEANWTSDTEMCSVAFLWFCCQGTNSGADPFKLQRHHMNQKMPPTLWRTKLWDAKSYNLCFTFCFVQRGRGVCGIPEGR